MGEPVIEEGIILMIASTLVGSIIAAYQLFRIRLTLGPLFQGTLGTIIPEHILFGALWLVCLFTFALANWLELLTPDIRNWIRVGLAFSIMVIVWLFVYRTHRWYRRRGWH